MYSSPGWLSESWEESCSYLRNCDLICHVDSIVKSARADDAVLSAVHYEATKAGVGWILLVVFRKTIVLIDCHYAWNIILAFKHFDLAKHKLFVLRYGIVNNSG